MTRKTAKFYRDGLVLVMLGLLAVAGPLLGTPHKFDRGKTMGFAAMIPASPGEWSRVSIRDSDDMPETLDINELYQALFEHPELGRVALTLEYTSDSRREFELHYPDICHSVRGDQVIPYAPGRIELSDGQHIDAAMMSWQQRIGGHSAVTAYWYLTADGVTTDSGKLKFKQAMAGLLSEAEDAVMVRFDAFYEQPLSARKRAELFSAIKTLSHDIENEIDPRSRTMLYAKIEKEEI